MKKEHKQLLVGFTLALLGTALMILAFPSPLGFLFAPFAGVGGTMMISVSLGIQLLIFEYSATGTTGWARTLNPLIHKYWRWSTDGGISFSPNGIQFVSGDGASSTLPYLVFDAMVSALEKKMGKRRFMEWQKTL